MKNENRLVIEKSYAIRPESNGMTVYDKKKHKFFFFEGLTTEDVHREVPALDCAGFTAFMKVHEDRMTVNIRTDRPLYIGWQLSAECNLDCIYCFADTTLHQGNTTDIADVAKSILALEPVCVGLSGGEPTLNRKLPEIMELFKGRADCILNTNGTTPLLQHLVPQLKETGTLVRISIDSTSNSVQNALRPVKGNRALDFDQMRLIRKSVEMLLDADVPLEIHTVVSTRNMNNLEQTAEDLIAMGVRRWHLYRMDPSPKCADIYESIRVDHEEIAVCHQKLLEKYGSKLDITAATDVRAGSRERAILLIDSNGRFMVKGKNQAVIYVGRDPKAPTKEELVETMDFEVHKRCYYMNYVYQACTEKTASTR